MFISPSEPPMIQAIGIVSPLPEQYGVDILWNSRLGMIGIQRKQFPSDFLASTQDGRLNREYLQMKQLDIAMLLIEGIPRWTLEGELIGDTHRGKRSYSWSRVQHRDYIASVQMRGIQVHSSDSLTDTVDFVNGLRVWSDKRDHHSLDQRPDKSGRLKEAAEQDDVWGSISSSSYIQYLYQSLPGVGPAKAGAIYRQLGMIFRLTVSQEELEMVPGMGKRGASMIVEMFNGK